MTREKANPFLQQIHYCVRHINIPDLHSFTVRVPGGLAFVEAQWGGTVIVDVNAGDCEHKFFTGTAIETAAFLESVGADPRTIET